MAHAPKPSQSVETTSPSKASPPKSEATSPPIEAVSSSRAEQATADAASPKSWTLPSRSKTASPTLPGSPPGEQPGHDKGGDTVTQETQIEVDQQVCLALPRKIDVFSKSMCRPTKTPRFQMTNCKVDQEFLISTCAHFVDLSPRIRNR